jgi:hypothetical protein
MSKLYALITEDATRVSLVNPLSTILKADFFHVEITIIDAARIDITYNYSEKIKGNLGLRLPLKDELKVQDVYDKLSPEFQNEVKEIYPGSKPHQKLYNFFLLALSLYISSIDSIRISENEPELSSLFDPWEIILPEYDNLEETCNISFYKSLEYYITPMLSSPNPKVIIAKVLGVINKFWRIFGEYFDSGDHQDDLTPIYGSILNMYKIFNSGSHTGINQIDVLSELEVKHLEYVERSESVWVHFSKISQDLEDVKSIYKEVNDVLDECNIYASELKEYVGRSKKELSMEVKSASELHTRKITEAVNNAVLEKIGSLDSVIENYFKDIEAKHEYKLARRVEEILSRRDELLLELTNKYNEYRGIMTKCKQDSILEFKSEVSTFNRNALSEHRDISGVIHKYKLELDRHLQLKKTEFERDISGIIEKETRRVVDEELQNVKKEIGTLFEAKSEEFTKTILLLADKVKALESKQ